MARLLDSGRMVESKYIADKFANNYILLYHSVSSKDIELQLVSSAIILVFNNQVVVLIIV